MTETHRRIPLVQLDDTRRQKVYDILREAASDVTTEASQTPTEDMARKVADGMCELFGYYLDHPSEPVVEQAPQVEVKPPVYTWDD